VTVKDAIYFYTDFPAGALSGVEIIEHREDAVDVGVLIIEAVEGAGEPHRIR